MRAELLAWAQAVKFNPDPEMPAGVRNRAADNWRVLLAIADAAGEEWAREARKAALELSLGQDEDQGVRLLTNILTVFDAWADKRLPSHTLLARLLDLPDSPWG